MRIEKVTLRNIRSYEEATVSLPDGITLLSGDIGSGKTSILLAIEFALFGIIRGSFSGTSLLRHGADKGSVTLTFTVDDDQVTVHRALKRTSRGVRQQSGWYEVNGEREDATAREIKAEVIDLLGYPSSLVTKSKSMLYRYTVYTPQEAMKEILRESADQRLEKIRKVLHLDKYKRVKENAELYARELKREIKNDEENLPDKSSVEEKLDSYEEQLGELEEEEAELIEEKASVDTSLDDVSDDLNELEAEREELNELEKEYERVKSRLTTVSQDIKEAKEDIESKQNRVKDDLEEPKRPADKPEEIREKQAKAERGVEKLKDKASKIQGELRVIEEKISDAEDIKDRIGDLDECPTCGQTVDDDHEETVTNEQDELIESLQEDKAEYEEKLDDVQEKLTTFKTKREELRERYEDAQSAKQARATYKQKKKRNEELKEDITSLQERVDDKQDVRDEVKKRKSELEAEIQDYEDLQDDVDELKDKQQRLRERKEEITSSLATCKEKQRSIADRLEEARGELEAFEELQASIQRRRTTHTWITEHFANLLDVIEQHVLLTVQQRFDESFRSFFEALIDDEQLRADIDTEFTPRVTQQGYDVDIDDLSGGEKTSVALAYRLAMNDVINDYMEEVRTDDLLVLDEPTDGFSGEQLDRLRDILKDLQASQIILVSHEEKLEGVTEHLLRVRKVNSRSEVTR
jgi:exonuclease SbcC